MAISVEKYYPPQPSDIFEVIACVYIPKSKKWTCLSAADVGSPKYFPGKHEILEVEGHKFGGGGLEMVGFNPGQGKVTWISFDRDTIIEELFDDIRSLVKTGKTEWERR